MTDADPEAVTDGEFVGVDAAVCDGERVFVGVREGEGVLDGVCVAVAVCDGVCDGVADEDGHIGGSTTPRYCASAPLVSAGVDASSAYVFVAVFHEYTADAEVVVDTETAYSMNIPDSTRPATEYTASDVGNSGPVRPAAHSDVIDEYVYGTMCMLETAELSATHNLVGLWNTNVHGVPAVPGKMVDVSVPVVGKPEPSV